MLGTRTKKTSFHFFSMGNFVVDRIVMVLRGFPLAPVNFSGDNFLEDGLTVLVLRVMHLRALNDGIIVVSGAGTDDVHSITI